MQPVPHWRQLPSYPCSLLLMDQPLRHDLLLGSAWLHRQRPQCRSAYLLGELSPLRVHVAERCQPIASLHLNEETLQCLPQRINEVLSGQSYLSPSIAVLKIEQAFLLRQLAALSWMGLVVLVQMVEGATPKVIAHRLGVSVGSIYQQQARLRAYFGVADTAELRNLLQPVEAFLEGV